MMVNSAHDSLNQYDSKSYTSPLLFKEMFQYCGRFSQV